MERKVKMGGGELVLAGNEIKTGDVAPDFTVVDKSLKPVKLSDFKGQTVVISVVPSLDTPTCDLQTKRFNKEATNLSKDVKILTLSMDLPFAQARWCGAAGVENVLTLSDHKDADFGMKYGVLVKDLRLLARAVFVVDKNGIVRHSQLVQIVKDEPDYDSVLKTVKSLL